MDGQTQTDTGTDGQTELLYQYCAQYADAKRKKNLSQNVKETRTPQSAPTSTS